MSTFAYICTYVHVCLVCLFVCSRAGLFLGDLTFIEDGNKDNMNNMINFFKRGKARDPSSSLFPLPASLAILVFRVLFLLLLFFCLFFLFCHSMAWFVLLSPLSLSPPLARRCRSASCGSSSSSRRITSWSLCPSSSTTSIRR